MLPNNLTNYFYYKDGYLLWKVAINSRAKIGKPAGSVSGSGYLQVRLHGKAYLVHRIIWALFGNQPSEVVDHIDGNKLNNLITNLRAATKTQNQYNKKKPQNSTSGIKNVYWSNSHKKWCVAMRITNGKKTWFGSYDDKELAELVATEVREIYHGEYARS